MLVRITDRAKQVVTESLADAALTQESVDFYACHQAFRWLREVTQKYTGLTRARAVDHFHWTGTVSAANLPLQLAIGEKERLAQGRRYRCHLPGRNWNDLVLDGTALGDVIA